ncbi:pirin-like C-terminal cupin domain-containing protein [Psychrobacter sp.]|uniref:pirin family protein n=1 Tax=Psychrobacter sp. TaxID=56811 RepID=UPI0025E53684|nr:pirin-like C-terminal cupin domain-containing protein [Psychrobacter sp.]
MKTTTLDPRLADVGGIPIARLLPNKGKEPIGAWCFMDHAGPAEFDEGEEGMQVGRHPHINLQTFSWMIDGEVLHKDSIGNEQVITKNQVNVMTAGTGNDQGISHTEQSVFPNTGGSKDAWHGMNMVQLWIALPLDQKIERNFHHYPELPSWNDDKAEYVLTTGDYTTPEGRSYKAPTIQYSKLIGLDVHFLKDAEVALSLEPGMDYGILMVVDGIEYQGEKFEQNQLIRFDDITQKTTITVKGKQGTRIMLLGGEPLNQKVLLWWNFVSDNKEDIEQAITDWNNHHPRFGNVDSELRRLEAPALPEGFKS